jgi:hypothetical protein
MHTRIVAGVAAVLFTTMACISFLVVDLRDRSLPVALGARSVLTLETGSSDKPDDEVLTELAQLSDADGLGLYRVAPDLMSGAKGEVFVEMTARGGATDRTIPRFGNQPAARVLGIERLDHSPASGRYLVTGAASGEGVLTAWASRSGFQVHWDRGTLRENLGLLASQPTPLTAVAAAALLMVVIVVYWFAVRARGRALRVLGGVPTQRIQRDDIVQLTLPVLAAGLAVGAALVVISGVARGWVFAPTLAIAYGAFAGAILLATVVGALIVSAASWPTPRMLAERLPAVGSLRRVTNVLKVGSLVLLLASVSPALAAINDARASAAEQAQWRVLDDAVVLDLLGGASEEEWRAHFEGPVSGVVREAAADGRAAISYYVPPEDLAQYAPDDTGSGLAIVDSRWLELFHRTALPLPGNGTVPPAALAYLETNMPLWTKPGATPPRLSFQVVAGEPLPVVKGGSGQLVFPEKTVLLVVDDLRPFTDDWVASLASTSNFVLQGLAATLDSTAAHGLTGRVRVEYIAEDGLLRAQLTAYLAWLQLVALVALLVALVVAAAVAAFISSTSLARRDFPLLLTGAPPGRVVARRALREMAAVAVVAAVVAVLVTLAHGPGAWLVACVGVAVAALVPAVHRAATHRMFGAVVRRAL